MAQHTALPALCPDHGEPKNRKTCAGCNSAYMRGYLRKRSKEEPDWAVWHRAKKRAQRLGIPFDLPRSEVVIPARCPVMGMPLVLGQARSSNSPSLDRIDPRQGYVTGNCRVISDHANRIKGNLDLDALKSRAENGPAALKDDYRKVVLYVEREQLLVDVRARALMGGSKSYEWAEIANFLENRFRRGRVTGS